MEYDFGNSLQFNTWQNQNKEKVATNTVCKHSTCVYVSVRYKSLCSYKSNGSESQSQRFNNQRNLPEISNTHTRHLLLVALEINWSSVLLKCGNREVALPTSVTIPLINKCKIKSFINSNEAIFYIMLFIGVTQKAPYKFNTIAIKNINQSVYYAPTSR